MCSCPSYIFSYPKLQYLVTSHIRLCSTHCRTEQLLAQKKEKEQEGLKKNLVDPFEEREEDPVDAGDEREESGEMMDMDDSRLGPPFGIVLNGHSLVRIHIIIQCM